MNLKTFKLLFSLQIILLLFSSELLAFDISIDKSSKTRFTIIEDNYLTLKFRNTVASIEINSSEIKNDNFSSIHIPGFGHTMVPGEPKLPVLKKLIEIPCGADIEISIKNASYIDYDLTQFGVNNFIVPAQPALSKNIDNPKNIDFVINKQTYLKDQFIGQEIVFVKILGTMRGVNLARLEIAPVQYNPVQNTIRVYNFFEAEISFTKGDVRSTKNQKSALFSPFIEGIYSKIVNYKSLSPDELIINVPSTYIIVSDPMFESNLQPFVLWKTRKGFKVVEAYTNDPLVGNTTESIKAYLENFYHNPPNGYLPQSYVLIVGDIDQVPSFKSTQGFHYTDLYYAEYSGDFLPDCYYGRFSANTIVELKAQLNKTLDYEQYQLVTPAYLDSSLLIYIDYGISTPQLSYARLEYLNIGNGITTHAFYPGNTDWDPVDKINNGVSYVHYCGPCSSSGFPSLSLSDLSSLNNYGKYALIVGNCNGSANFGITSLGEEIVRATDKGALSFIGTTNSTYFEEDFWWAVGYKELSFPILYNSDYFGFYDRWFHNHGEPVNDWFTTQGQFPVAGNLAVSQSGSSLESYYWEIYHLLGDPSICIYLPEPSLPVVDYSESLTLEDTVFLVNTEPYLYVALSMNGVLHGVAVSDESGNANISIFEPFSQSGVAEIIVTGQNVKPYFGTIDVGLTSITDYNPVLGHVSISPNPFTEKVKINIISKSNANLQILMFDVFGRVIKKLNYSVGEKKEKYSVNINASDLIPGLYFIQIKAKGAQKIFKIIKLE